MEHKNSLRKLKERNPLTKKFLATKVNTLQAEVKKIHNDGIWNDRLSKIDDLYADYMYDL